MARPSRIKDLPLSTRPREKLLARGRENLSDGEILALLLGSGSSKQNAITPAKNLGWREDYVEPPRTTARRRLVLDKPFSQR